MTTKDWVLFLLIILGASFVVWLYRDDIKEREAGKSVEHLSLPSQTEQTEEYGEKFTIQLPTSEDDRLFDEYSIYGRYFYTFHVRSTPRDRTDGYYEWYCDEYLPTTDDTYRYFRRHRAEIIRQMRERGVIE